MEITKEFLIKQREGLIQQLRGAESDVNAAKGAIMTIDQLLIYMDKVPAEEALAKFEEDYAQRSGVSVEWLHQHKQRAIRCDCGEPGCQGWQIVNEEGEKFHKPPKE